MARSAKASVHAAKPPHPHRTLAGWKRKFLDHLAETSNVSASSKHAGIHSSTAYEAKRNNPEFNREWRQALCEGYELLEMELLDRLRTGDLRNSKAQRAPRVFDNAIAFRLLIAHREEAGRQRGVRDNADTEAIFASIDAKLDRMREREMAGASETESDDAAQA